MAEKDEPPRPLPPRPGGVADDRSVDMDERRDPPPEPGSDRRITSVAGQLSPTQQAWSRYVTHGLKCPQCRSLEAGRCDDAEQLHRRFHEASTQAFDRLADEG